MPPSLIDTLRAQLEGPRDGAMLRFALGDALLKAGDAAAAAEAARHATEFDPDYSAAWRLRGKALTETGERDAAIAAYQQGIQVAEARGDIQAGKEMRVFLKRLEKAKTDG